MLLYYLIIEFDITDQIIKSGILLYFSGFLVSDA